MAYLLSALTPLDWCVLVIVGVGVFTGIRRGFARMLLDVAPLAAAFVLPAFVPDPVRAYLAGLLPVPEPFLPLAVDVALWVALYALVWLLTRPLGVAIPRVLRRIQPLSALDRVLGALTGGARAALFLGLILAPFVLVPIPNPVDQAASTSVLARPLGDLDRWVAATELPQVPLWAAQSPSPGPSPGPSPAPTPASS